MIALVVVVVLLIIKIPAFVVGELLLIVSKQ
jgi:hypothetical protein